MMDLGISGRRAVVCASSRGLGRACARALAAAGVDVLLNGRDPDRLEATRAELEAEGFAARAVAADLSTAEGRAVLIAAAGDVEILVNNNGGPPPRDFLTLDEEKMRAGIEANMIAPAQLVRAFLPAMVERRWGRIVNITSGSVRMPMAGLDLSSGARAGLTAMVAGVARAVARHNVTINNLLPGQFDTDRIMSLVASQAEASGKSIEEVRATRQGAIPARRFGDPAEFGAACAFLCSAQAGYITGQSLLIDGGAFPGI